MHAYIPQVPSDVNYAFIDKAVDLSIFNVVKKKNLQLGPFNIEAAVLTESHALVINKGSVHATEICACTDIKSLVSDLTYSQNLMDLASAYECDIEKNFHYTFTSQLLTCDKDKNPITDISDSNTRHSIIQEFPAATDELEIPRTEIHISLSGDTLITESIHSYPDLNKMIYTKSSWN